MGAVQYENDAPLYVSCRDDNNVIQEGSSGIFTDMSTGTFRTVMLSGEPGPIRSNWW